MKVQMLIGIACVLVCVCDPVDEHAEASLCALTLQRLPDGILQDGDHHDVLTDGSTYDSYMAERMVGLFCQMNTAALVTTYQLL